MVILQKQPSSAKNLSKLLVIEEKTIIASLMEMLNEERILQKDFLFYINE
jgi:DNA replication initiation complex subunit (GINS family)